MSITRSNGSHHSWSINYSVMRWTGPLTWGKLTSSKDLQSKSSGWTCWILFQMHLALFWVQHGSYRCDQQQTAFKNIVGKEQIARNKQFLLFPQCFLSSLIIVPPLSMFLTSFLFVAELAEPEIGISSKGLTLYSIETHQQKTAFENIVGKGEIACHEQFFLFPQCFLLK